MTQTVPSSFTRFRERLLHKQEHVGDRPVIYTAFGDSVTQGWFEHATCDSDHAFPTLFKRRAEQRYPAAAVNLINAGVAGDTAVRSLARAERDLLAFQPDLVTIGFGVNDAHSGEAGLDDYRRALSELIRLVRARTEADLLLISPSWLMTADNPYIHENERKHVEPFLRVARSNALTLYRDAIMDIARSTATPCLDVYAMWTELDQAGVDIHSRLANGINHPDRAFHAQVADAIERMIFD